MRELQWVSALHIKNEHIIEKGELSTTIKKKLKILIYWGFFYIFALWKFLVIIKVKTYGGFGFTGEGYLVYPQKVIGFHSQLGINTEKQLKFLDII